MLLAAIAADIVWDNKWLIALPISAAVLWAMYIHYFTRCPECGARMRPRQVTDPWSGTKRVLYDCLHCDTEWISDITHSGGDYD
jgi:hypothetical protein